MQIFRALFVCLLFTLPGLAETQSVFEHPRPGAKPSKLWRLSVAVLAVGSATDAWSSYGRQEANPLLRGPGGQFTGRAIGIKAAIAGGTVAGQWLVMRKRPESARAAAIANFGMTGIFMGVAVRNRSIR